LHVISRRKLREAADQNSELSAALEIWYRIAKKAEWQSIEDVRNQFPSADAVGKHTVFNIKGNHYRLIVEIYYRSQVVLVRHVLTHAEYDRGDWKK